MFTKNDNFPSVCYNNPLCICFSWCDGAVEDDRVILIIIPLKIFL